MNEEWKPCVGLEDSYIVSNLGNVRYLKSTKNRVVYFGKPTKRGQPSGLVSIKVSGKQKMLRIHRLVAQAFLPNPNNYTQINHKDGNRRNNCVDNLEWCNNSQNIQHAYDTGLIKYSRQLSEADLQQLYIGLEAGFDQHAMARMLNVDASTISNIVTKNTYKTIGLDFSKFSKSYYTNKAREDVEKIRQMYKETPSSNKIAKLYNVSGRFIRHLLESY